MLAKILQGFFEIKYANMPDEFHDDNANANPEKTEDSTQSEFYDLSSDSSSDSGSEDSVEERKTRSNIPQEQLEKVTEQISVLTTETKKKRKNNKKRRVKEGHERKEIEVDDLHASEPQREQPLLPLNKNQPEQQRRPIPI
ncbi:hypothetical protein AVEN_15185-1 [Araneus ventricosus]|uniref:Uncharacterized protein n=1 Tax=Araneus ventricosus TaxID=182803 RepID=A0A4Y2MNR1_ARAVE|nr:hypothetical protein AVEN_15185-1 [Araneus ventricosus]